MAIPKRKLSSAKQDKKRSNIRRLSVPVLARCPKRGEYKLAHRVYGSCGYCNGKDVLKKEARFLYHLRRKQRRRNPPLLFLDRKFLCLASFSHIQGRREGFRSRERDSGSLSARNGENGLHSHSGII